MTGGYQALLQALSYAILSGSLGDVPTIMSRPGSAELLKSVLFGHLAYARERLEAASDTEAATVFVRQLVSQLTGKDASSIVTVNDLVVALSDLIDDNASSPFVESLLGRAATTLAKNPPAETIKTVLSLYHPQDAQAGTPVVAQSEIFQGERMRALAEVVSRLLDSLVPGVPSGTRGAGLSLAAASEQDLEAQLKTYLLDFLRALSQGSCPHLDHGHHGRYGPDRTHAALWRHHARAGRR